MKLFFMCHPVRPYEDQYGVPISVRTNLERVIKWQSLCLQEGFPTIAPYYELCAALDDSKPEDRKFGMEIDKEVIHRSDGIILCGEKVSSGMQSEWDFARENNIPFIKLYGYTPEEARRILQAHRSWLV